MYQFSLIDYYIFIIAKKKKKKKKTSSFNLKEFLYLEHFILD